MRTYSQLTQAQRYQIYSLRKTRHSLSEIAFVIGIHKSSVSRELKRNRGKRGYRPQRAHELASRRRQKSIPRVTAEIWATVENLLRQDWSPEQISGRLKKEKKVCICHEWIYQYVLKVNRQAVTYTDTCVVRRNAVNATEAVSGGANYPIAAVSKSVQPSSAPESAQGTGK